MFAVGIADLKTDGAQKKFICSIRDTGFAVLKNHGIDYSLVEDVSYEWKKFFSQPAQIKEKFLFQRNYKIAQDGFFPIKISETAKGSSFRDYKEFFHIYPFSNLPPQISEKTFLLRSQLVELAKILLSWLEEALPVAVQETLSMPLCDMVDEEYQTLLRVLHYPPLPEGSKKGVVRAAPHEDINLITLLVAATAPGLQVRDLHGNWHDVPCEKENIVVNVGDMLQECSQGYFPATTHQVVTLDYDNALSSRYSFPLFLHPRNEVVLSKRYTALAYRNERLSELGLL